MQKSKMKIHIRTIKICNDIDSMIDYISILSIIMIMPFFYSINSFVNYGIRGGLGLFFLVCIAKKDSKMFTKCVAVLLAGLFYTLIYLYNVRLAYGGGYASFFVRSMLCWLYMIYGIYYAKYRFNTNNKILGVVFTLVMIITIITSIVGMSKYAYLVPGNETITRTLGNGGEFSDEARKILNRSNIANWQLAYGFACASSAYVMKYSQERKKRYLVIVGLIILFLVRSQITFALLFAAIPVVFYFLYHKSIKLQIIKLFIFLIISIIVIINISSVLYSLYSFMLERGITMLAIRFYQLYESVKGGALVGTGAGRIDLYTLSISQFFSHPILGYKVENYSELFTKLGMHSQIFDTLGGTGIIGFLFAFLPFLYVVKSVRMCHADRTDKAFINLGIFILIIFMITNPTSYACESYMAVFCLPFWLNLRNKGLNMT